MVLVDRLLLSLKSTKLETIALASICVLHYVLRMHRLTRVVLILRREDVHDDSLKCAACNVLFDFHTSPIKFAT